MKILFDNIIYSLQAAGGISVVWTELLARVLNDRGIEATFIEHENENLFRNNLRIPENNIMRNVDGIMHF